MFDTCDTIPGDDQLPLGQIGTIVVNDHGNSDGGRNNAHDQPWIHPSVGDGNILPPMDIRQEDGDGPVGSSEEPLVWSTREWKPIWFLV